MEKQTELIGIDSICNRVYVIRGQQVMRNIVRFPEDFMFRLTREEMEFVKLQNVISRENYFFEGQGGGRRKLPYAFTEQGIYTAFAEW